MTDKPKEKIKHDFSGKSPSGWTFCKNCGRIRQANGSTDKKPCFKAKLSLRFNGECSHCKDGIYPPSNGAPEACDNCEKLLDEGRRANMAAGLGWTE